MPKNFAAAFVLALSASACATAGSTAGAASAGGTAPSGNPDHVVLPDGTRLVCSMEMATGSHIRERVCRRDEAQTPAEKEAIRQFMQPAWKKTKND